MFRARCHPSWFHFSQDHSTSVILLERGFERCRLELDVCFKLDRIFGFVFCRLELGDGDFGDS
jgi:hypothetical protein